MRSVQVALLLLPCLVSILSCRKAENPQLETYRVYSAFLSYQTQGHIDDQLRPDTGVTAILSQIPALSSAAIKALPGEVRDFLPGIETETISSVVQCSTMNHRLSAQFILPVPYALAETTYKTEKLGYLQLSCVGFNVAKTQAAFHIDRVKCGTCGVGKWILMKKSEDGQWHIQSEAIDWIV